MPAHALTEIQHHARRPCVVCQPAQIASSSEVLFSGGRCGFAPPLGIVLDLSMRPAVLRCRAALALQVDAASSCLGPSMH